MSEYKSIKGTKIQNYTTDPDNPLTGQVWYNETSQTLKFQYTVTNPAWSTGGNMNSGRFGLAGAGTQTAALGFSGYPGPTGLTESYNGSTWTEVADTGSSRYDLAGAGTQTSALAFGGGPTSAQTESWNGTSWSDVADLNTARKGIAGAGADNTSALAFGGNKVNPAPPPTVAKASETESWNGTSWTEVNDLNTARDYLAGTGIQTASLAFGGRAPTAVAVTESWNGTNWTEVNDLNTARFEFAGNGTYTSAVAFGGEDGLGAIVGATESWNGTSWTNQNSLSNARKRLAGAGADNTSGLAFGGINPAEFGSTSTEEFNTGVATGAWATGGDLNTARSIMGNAGDSNTSALGFGGFQPPGLTNTVLTESYNGTSWTEVNDLNTARQIDGTGTQTAALGFGGSSTNPAPPPGTLYVALTESWNGTSWTEVNDLNTARYDMGSFGTQTASITAGGTSPTTAATESWNGTSWTEVNDLNTGRYSQGSAGVQTAGLIFGGMPTYVALTESWNGTSWTEVNDLNTGRAFLSGSGTQTAGLAFGGSIPPQTGVTESWNGTSWTEVNDLSIGRNGLAGTGTQTSTLAFGGFSPTVPGITTATEEWNDGIQTKTITSS